MEKTQSQIEPRRVPGGKQDNPSREAFNANHCIRQQTVFFLFLGSPPGFFFTVTVQQGSYSLSLSLSVPLSSSLTVRALELEASLEMLPKEDRGLPESETCHQHIKLQTYSAVSGRTRSLARPFPLSFRGFLTAWHPQQQHQHPPKLHPERPQQEQLLRRDGLHGSFFVDMPRQKHAADHTDIPLSSDP